MDRREDRCEVKSSFKICINEICSPYINFLKKLHTKVKKQRRNFCIKMKSLLSFHFYLLSETLKKSK